MSTNSQDAQFEKDVDHLIATLAEASWVVADASVNRTFFRRGVARPIVEAERELEGLRAELIRLYRELDPFTGAQLRREVSVAQASVSREVMSVSNEVEAQPIHRRASYQPDTGNLRHRVEGALNAIIPPAPTKSAANSPADRAPRGSLLPPAAREFARGGAATESIGEHLDSRNQEHWKEQIKRHGVKPAMRELTRQAGGDPLAATRLATRALGGPLLGYELDPETREPKELAVVNPNHSALVLGKSGTGKTESVLAPYALGRLAQGHNLMLVTPQVDTIAHVVPTGRALTGQPVVPVIDFGGEIVAESSELFVAWDVTRKCLTLDGANEFAKAFAGEHLKARQNLSNPEYWGGLVEDLYRTAGHIAAAMREAHGLDPYVNGMARVYDLIKTPGKEPLGKEPPAAVRRALAHSPAALEKMESLYEAASSYASEFHPRLQQIAFQAYVLRANGIPLSDEIVGADPRLPDEERRRKPMPLEELSEQLQYVATSMGGKPGAGQRDPMVGVLRTFRSLVPEHEALVMSPKRGVREVDPRELVEPGAGLSVVTYSQTKSTGLAAGAFTSEALAHVVDENVKRRMLSLMGSAQSVANFGIVVDEGSAGGNIPLLPDVLTNFRQLGISGMLSMTSVTQLEMVFGEHAGKFLDAPLVIDVTPSPARAAEFAKLFGERVVRRRTKSDSFGATGGSSTSSEQISKEDVLHQSDIANLGLGLAMVQYQSRGEGNLFFIAGIPQLAAPESPVGAAVAYVAEHPEHFEAVQELLEKIRPDYAEMVALEKDPIAAIGAGTPEALKAALAEPEMDPAEPVGSPEAEAVEAPAAEPVETPAAEPAENPLEALKQLVAELEAAQAELVKEAAPEPVDAAPAAEPAEATPAPDPVKPEPAPEPVKDSAPEPVEPQPAAEPVESEPAPEPVKDSAPDPVEPEPAPEPVKDSAPDPVDAAPAAGPEQEPTPEPAEAPASEPADGDPVTEPSYPATEPVDAAPAAGPEQEPTPEPAEAPASEPADGDPVTEPVDRPASEEEPVEAEPRPVEPADVEPSEWSPVRDDDQGPERM